MEGTSSLLLYDVVGENLVAKNKKRPHLVVLIVILLILVLLGVGMAYVYYVYLPSVIDDSDVLFESVLLTDPWKASLRLVANVSLNVSSVFWFGVNLVNSPFSLKFEGEEIGVFYFPEAHVKLDGTSNLSVSSRLNITNSNQFTRFGKQMLFSDSILWTIEGRLNVKIWLFKFSVAMKKDVELVGVGGFDDLKILSFDLTQSNTTHIVAVAVSRIYNPSIVSIDPLGDLSLDLFYNNSFLSTVTAHRVNVSGGWNTLLLRGAFLPDDLDIASRLVGYHLSGKAVNVTAKSSSRVSSIPLFTPILEGLEVKTTLDGNKTELVKNLKVIKMKLNPVASGVVEIDAALECELFNPLGPVCPFIIKHVSFDVDIQSGNQTIGSIITTYLSPTQSGNTLYIELNDTLTVYGDGENLSNFMLQFIEEATVNLVFDRFISGKIETVIGVLEVNDFPITVSTEIQGMNNLPHVDIVSYDIPRDAPNGVIIELEVTIFNPSTISVNLGNALLEMLYQGHTLGILHSNNSLLSVGYNNLTMSGIISPENMTSASYFFSRYLNGYSTDVFVRGISTDIHLPWLDQSLRNLILGTSLEGSNAELIQTLDIDTILLDFIRGPIPVCAGVIGAIIKIPFGFSYEIISIRMDVHLLYNSSRVVNIIIPEQTVRTEGEFVYVEFDDIPLVISNLELFSPFVDSVFFSEEVIIGVEGTATASTMTNMGGIELNEIYFTTNAVINGMDNLKNVDILDFDIPTNSDDGGLEVVLNCTIENPSPLSSSIGRTTFEILYKNSVMGYVTSDTLNLFSGLNNYELVGNINPLKEDIDHLNEFVSRFLNGDLIEASVKGVSSDTALLNQTVQNLELFTSIQGLQDWSIITTLVIHDMFIDLNAEPQYVNGDFTGGIDMPFGFPFEIISTQLTLFLVLENVQICSIVVSKSDVSQPDSATLNIVFDHAPMKILNEQLFSTFIDTLLRTESSYIGIDGITTAQINTNLDNEIQLQDIKFATGIEITGTNSFKNPEIKVTGLDVTGSSMPNVVDLTVSIIINNPSDASFDLGRIKLDIYQQGIYIGYGIADELKLLRGDNPLTVKALVFKTNSNLGTIQRFISNFLMGIPSQATLKGNPETDITSIRKALTNLAVDVSMPGLTTGLIQYASLRLDLWQAIRFRLPAKLTVVNPLSTDIRITHVNFDIIYKGTTIGNVDTDVDIFVPRSQTSITPEITVRIIGVTIDLLKSILGELHVDATGSLSATINNQFPITIDYTQKDIPGRLTRG